MVYTGWHNEQVIRAHLDANPGVLLAPDIKVSVTVAYVTNLLVLMQVLFEERLDLILVCIAHCVWRHDNFIAIPITSVGCELVHFLHVGKVVA